MKTSSRILAVAILAAPLAACGGNGGQEQAAPGNTESATPAATEAAPAAAASSEAAPAAAATTPAAASTTAAAATTPAAAAPASFTMCKTCHSTEPGKTIIGPSLAGVYGTKAAEVPGYQFSPALKAAGLTWNDATLDKWIENPMKLVPGTKMTYAGQPDAAKRKEIIAYLKTLKK